MTTPTKPLGADAAVLSSATPPVARSGMVAFVVGWVLSAIPILMLGVSNLLMLAFGVNREMSEKGLAEQGFPAGATTPLAAIAMVSAFLFAVPRTAVLGAILLVGYFGGAVCVHVRSGDGLWWIAVTFGVITWLGLYLRDPRVRRLVPLREPLRK
jgi:hypothetical protein